MLITLFVVVSIIVFLSVIGYMKCVAEHRGKIEILQGCKTSDEFYSFLEKEGIINDLRELIEMVGWSHLKYFPTYFTVHVGSEEFKDRPKAGGFKRGTEIHINPKAHWTWEGLRSTLLHEYVHAIQGDSFGGYSDHSLDYLSRPAEIEAYTLQYLSSNRGKFKGCTDVMEIVAESYSKMTGSKFTSRELSALIKAGEYLVPCGYTRTELVEMRATLGDNPRI